MKIFIFVIIILLVGALARSGIFQEIMRGYNIVQLIDKGSLKTITVEEYHNYTIYKKYFDAMKNLETPNSWKERMNEWLKDYDDAYIPYECLDSPYKCDYLNND